jgi:hypothetical protein
MELFCVVTSRFELMVLVPSVQLHCVVCYDWCFVMNKVS